jgi:hypothetical protein
VAGVRQGTSGKAPVTPGKTQGTPDEALVNAMVCLLPASRSSA